MKSFCRFLLCFICLSFLFSCSSTNRKNSVASPDNAAVHQNKKELIHTLNDSVFCISIIVKGKDNEKRFSVGTGFLVGDGLIASALHVQTKAEELFGKFERPPSKIVAWKKFATGEIIEFPVEIAVSDDKSDLAIYRFDSQALRENQKFLSLKPLILAEKLPPVGEEVVAVGYYGAYEFPFNSMGNVAMIDKNDDIFSDLTLMPGNSGAPVCSLETGEVLGITTDVLDLGNETVRYGIAKSVVKLRELLQKL